jgi:cytochrome P450
MPREVPPGGDTVTIDGKQIFLPGGTSVGICQLGVQNRKDIFGDDTEIFRPERWLEDDEDKLAMMVRANDLGFGSGRFGCLGKDMARIEIQKAVFEVSHDRLICAQWIGVWRLYADGG